MEEYIETLKNASERLQLGVEASHYDENKDYYWNQKGQLQTVLTKNLPDDKLKMIFQNHINKLSKEKEPVLLQYPPVKVIPTPKFSTYVWA
jgi:hypothetical protein